MSELDADQLREIIDYDPRTGVFTWPDRNRRPGRPKPGTVAGKVNHNGYILISIKRRRYLAHRLAWLYVHGEWPAGDLDHRDNNPSNNSISNLRLASDSQNQANSVLAWRELPRGVTALPNGKFQAGIKVNGRSIHLGLHKTADEAHAAYLRAARDHFGEFLNTSYNPSVKRRTEGVSPDAIAAIKELGAAGLPHTRIATLVGCSPGYVGKIVRGREQSQAMRAVSKRLRSTA